MLKWANPVYHIILMMSQNLSHGFIHTTLLQWVIVDFLVCPLVLLLLKVMALTVTQLMRLVHIMQKLYFMSFTDIDLKEAVQAKVLAAHINRKGIVATENCQLKQRFDLVSFFK